MASRFTQTEKWDDKWFRQLSPNAKVLYWYVWDKCNIAGFWEVDLEGALFHTKIPQRGIEGAYKELARGFLANGDYVWIRKFLYHQRNLPLNENNPSHRGILKVINEFKSIFPNALEEIKNQLLKESEKGATKGLASPLSISKSKGKSKSKSKSKSKEFKPPTLEDVKKYISDNPELNNVDPNTFWKGFNDGGWIDTKGDAVRNWKLKLITWSNYGDRTDKRKTQRTANRPTDYAEQESEYGQTIE